MNDRTNGTRTLRALAASAVLLAAPASGFAQQEQRAPAATETHARPAADATALAPVEIHSEEEFLHAMVLHLRESLDTAQIARDRAVTPFLAEYAALLVEAQNRELELFRIWLADRYTLDESEYAYEPHGRDLTGLEGAELEVVFLQDAIRHHERGIATAEAYLAGDFPRHGETEEAALRMVEARAEEVRRMRGWLADVYGLEPDEVDGM